MRKRLLGQVLRLTKVVAIASLTGFASAVIIEKPSYAGSVTFFCGKSKGVPVTFARTQDGKNIPMVNWVSNNYFPPPWTDQKRCEEVSRRFQKNYDNGNLRNITTGKLRGEPVVCAAIQPNSPCTDRTLLFTLKRGANPRLTVQRLFDRRGLAAGNTLNESGENDINREDINIDFDTYLNNATGEATSQPSISESGNNP